MFQGVIKFATWCTFLMYVSTAVVPSNFPKCHIADPKINECLMRNSDMVISYLEEGIPEMNIPSLREFKIPKSEVGYASGEANFKMTLTNTTLYGLHDLKLQNFNFNPKKLSFSGTALFKQITMITHFHVNGKLMPVTINTGGDLETVLEPSTGSLYVTGELVTTKGKEHFEPKNVTVDIKVPGCKVHISGAFDGNKELEQLANKIINDNNREILKELLPSVNKVAEGVLSQMTKAIASTIPVEELFEFST
ncbi:hypothetical protein RI129_004313 [Pyrocoelia pectoralis]|uniref:Uncharacterized protein n=1 Tax=Pyrocoelia pectoralis TaxID=417401 RepID=A0AAN7VGI0_9COLE